MQEVRLDASLQTDQHSQYSQVEHLADLLPEYQFVYQPAHFYEHSLRLGTRDEEGLAIFSRFPIVHTSYLLASHNLSDPGDEHRRLVLHGVIRAPLDATMRSSKLIDVFVSHFPLGEHARNRVALDTAHFIRQNSVGVFQFFGGDLNAEPQDPSIGFFSGRLDAETTWDCYPFVLSEDMSGLRDAWLCLYLEPQPGEHGDEHERYGALTFASDNATKRIDYIFLGNLRSGERSSTDRCEFDGSSGSDTRSTQSLRMRVKDVRLIGQDPAAGSDKFAGQGFGMVHSKSPVYASDHRGVLVDVSVASLR